MDAAVGRITSALEEHKYPAENTLIVFCSDNGGIRRLGSNGKLRAGKGTLYEGGVRVPAVAVWADRLRPGVAVDEPLHVVDLFPTFVNLAGDMSEPTKKLDGRNLLPVFESGQASPHEFILHNLTPFHGAIRQGDWKLIRNGKVSANVTEPSKTETYELFNIRSDPSESNDLSKERTQIVDKLKAKLVSLATEAAKPNIPPNRPPDGFKSPKIWGEFD
jgi:arylsulfatase A-like enzyme